MHLIDNVERSLVALFYYKVNQTKNTLGRTDDTGKIKNFRVLFVAVVKEEVFIKNSNKVEGWRTDTFLEDNRTVT